MGVWSVGRCVLCMQVMQCVCVCSVGVCVCVCSTLCR